MLIKLKNKNLFSNFASQNTRKTVFFLKKKKKKKENV